MFRVTSEGRDFLLEEGTDQRYGARPLKRAIERYLVCPIARLLGTARLRPDDLLLIDRDPGDEELMFIRDTEQWSSYAQTAFAASNSGHLTAVEARG